MWDAAGQRVRAFSNVRGHSAFVSMGVPLVRPHLGAARIVAFCLDRVPLVNVVRMCFGSRAAHGPASWQKAEDYVHVETASEAKAAACDVMAQSQRVSVLAMKIAAHIRMAGLPPGTRLTERRLAEQFDMSRTPVKQALKLLADRDVVLAQQQGGFVVGAQASAGPMDEPDQMADEEQYLRLARDHLTGQLPDRVSENALMRRYGLKRTEVARVLHRAAREGWVERLPGLGWRFLPVLTSTEAYAQAYRFRLLIEPAGIMEPGFVADHNALTSCRAQQVTLLESEPGQLSRAAMFDIATSFHDVVIRCSRNAFFIESLTRLTRLRRLIEYDKTIDRDAWLGRCAQHLEIIDLLLAEDRPAAAALIRAHLEGGARSKTSPE